MADFQEYGFFDSEITGYDSEGFPILDRAQESDFFALFYAQLITNGVLARPANCLQVTAYEGMVITVNPGFLIINGRFGYNPESIQLTVDTASSQYPRITSVIGRLNHESRKMEIILKNGTPAPVPVPPELLQPASGDYYELCLAEIYLSSNQNVITQSSITDTRYDSAKCGIVTQLIDSIDTSVLYAQLEAFYEEFVTKSNNSYDEFVSAMENYLNNLRASGLLQMENIVNTLQAFEIRSEDEFTVWFESIKGQLSEDAAGHLLNLINELTKKVFNQYYGLVEQNTEFLPDGTIIQTNNEAVITTVKTEDAEGNKIITQTVEPILGTEYYVKTTTIYPATATTNKRIEEKYTTEYKS